MTENQGPPWLHAVVDIQPEAAESIGAFVAAVEAELAGAREDLIKEYPRWSAQVQEWTA